MKRRGYILMILFAAVLSGCLKDPNNLEDAPQIYSIGGLVTKSDGGAASGVSVMLVNITGGNTAGEAVTSATGDYVITGLSAGTYKIVAALSGYEILTTDEIKITNANVTVHAIVLQKIIVPTYTIGGSVFLPDGDAAADASVQIRKLNDNTIAGQPVTTGGAGEYLLSGIPAGEYTLIISLDGYETVILSPVVLGTENLVHQDITLQLFTIDANSISIVYAGNNVTIDNLPSDGSITATKSGADVTISTSSTSLVKYVVSGSTSGGSLKIQNNAVAPNTIRLTLNSAVIISSSKLPPIQITKNEGVTVVELKGNSILADHASNEENAALITKSGSLELEGYGSLNISGAAKHAIGSSKKSITVRNGNINITSAATDGFHSEEGFVISGGSLDITASGDGIDAGVGTAIINGGHVRINSSANDTKGVKADAGITIGGGRIEMNVSGAQSKGMSSKSDITVNNGDISIVTSGSTALETVGSGYAPSYCTAIKSDKNITVAGGIIQIESQKSADGGKGLSADGNIVISGGTLNITTAGDGKTYKTETGATDAYSANCIKSNQNISLLGGKITCSSSGTGGKGVNADGNIIIGVTGANNADLTLTVSTSGERFLVSGSSGGGQGGRPGGGGGNSADYANPKAVKCTGNMTIHSGTIVIKCTQKSEGGEGLESKKVLTVNGGNIDIRTYDDCINAGTSIVINNGNIYCAASGQDAIDSNGTFTINGGLTISNGVRGDGEAFDADRGVQVNGGIIVGTHGGNTMTSVSGSQRSTRIQCSAGSAIGIQNAKGEMLLLFNVPVISGASAGTSVIVTFSDPRFVSGSYTLLSGGSISGGASVNGYNTGGTYSGGASKSFSI